MKLCRNRYYLPASFGILALALRYWNPLTPVMTPRNVKNGLFLPPLPYHSFSSLVATSPTIGIFTLPALIIQTPP